MVFFCLLFADSSLPECVSRLYALIRVVLFALSFPIIQGFHSLFFVSNDASRQSFSIFFVANLAPSFLVPPSFSLFVFAPLSIHLGLSVGTRALPDRKQVFSGVGDLSVA